MPIARTENSQIVEYPVDFETLRQRFPHTMFPLPLTADALPSDYAMVESVVPPAAEQGHLVVEDEPEKVGDVWQQRWVQQLKPLAEVQTELKAKNLAKRLAFELAGVPYTFPDGAGTAQTRDARDLVNINGIASTGIVRAQQGVTDPIIPFRDEENVTHMLTPAQAIAFADHVGGAIAAAYQTKWDIDAQIDALASALAAADFDVEAAWSE